jgi:hypothetical protein
MLACSLKNESEIHETTSMSVCPSECPIEPISRYFGIQYGANAIEGDHDTILSYPVTPMNAKIAPFNVVP